MITGRPISEDDLHAYIDAALDTVRHAEVEAYLARHPDVALRVHGFANQREMLRDALAPIAQEPVPPELSLGRLLEERRRPPIASWRSAVAALVLLALGGAGGWFGHGIPQQPNGGVAALAQEASDSYAVYAADRVHPVEIRAADRAELVSWVSRRLAHPIAVPDLAVSGYRFMGGRLVATAHGPAGLFMYDDDRGTRLVMLVRPMAAEQNTSMAPYMRGSLSGFSWANNGIGYSLVGATSAQILHPLADEARRQIDKDV
jgi:anti-sigma factor RsiW